MKANKSLQFLKLNCPRHHLKILEKKEGGFFCSDCNGYIKEEEGKPVFISEEIQRDAEDFSKSGLLSGVKTLFRRTPWFYNFFFFIVGPGLFLGKKPKYIYEFLPDDAVVVDVGSGSRRIHPNVVNVDIFPWSDVDIVADAHNLPFVDNSVDGVINTWTLEHLKDPEKAVREFHRILKKDGHVYIATNFVEPFHPYPHDYYRWTPEGLRILLKDFEEIELRSIPGPTSALLAVLQRWISLFLSFDIKFLRDFFWILTVCLTFPLKLADLLLVRYKNSEYLSSGIYFIGRKR